MLRRNITADVDRMNQFVHFAPTKCTKPYILR
jgi:hypothetical protein